MISFAQNLEDVLIARFFRGDQPQLYVDVGAGHPSYHSVTKHFCDVGWHGLNIEPRTHLWKLLQAERPRDWNLQCAVAEFAGQMKFFDVTDPTFLGTDAGGLSTLDAQQAAVYRDKAYIVEEKILEVFPLSQLLAEHKLKDIGFLKIDVEGFEYQVVKSLDWEKWRPRLVITECTTPMTDIVCDDEVHCYLSQRGYLSVLFDGLNRYFVRQEDAERAPRLSVPANVTDGYVLAEELKLRRQLDEYKQCIEELTDKWRHAEASALSLERSLELLQSELSALQVATTLAPHPPSMRQQMYQLLKRFSVSSDRKTPAVDQASEESSRKAA